MSNLTLAELKEQLTYNPLTGEFRRKRGRWANQSAGTLKDSGYVRIMLNNKAYYAHRLAWFYEFGVWPKELLDHKNRIKHDNRISNLREASRAENTYNKVPTVRAVSGLRGVQQRPGDNRWYAQASYRKKNYYLGTFDTKEAASTAYKEFIRVNHKEFAKHDYS